MNKRYVIGIDGGGSTTECFLTDDTGTLLAHTISDGSNHQIVGIDLTVKHICDAIDKACHQVGITRKDLSYVYMGLAGADLEEDFILLNNAFAQVFPGDRFHIVNDTWIAFECGTGLGWGAVSICGTGTNIAVKHPNGEVFSVRALRYTLGNYGGGNHLSVIALHHAFRCDESTGPTTRLVEVLPQFCECETMDELAYRIYESNYTYHKKYNIPRLVFDLADEGDEVCLKIIRNMGVELGTMLTGLIKKAKLESTSMPVILSGSQYTKDKNLLLINALKEKLLEDVPHAKIHVVQCSPALGAVFGALRCIDVKLSETRRRDIQQHVEELFLKKE